MGEMTADHKSTAGHEEREAGRGRNGKRRKSEKTSDTFLACPVFHLGPGYHGLGSPRHRPPGEHARDGRGGDDGVPSGRGDGGTFPASYLPVKASTYALRAFFRRRRPGNSRKTRAKPHTMNARRIIRHIKKETKAQEEARGPMATQGGPERLLAGRRRLPIRLSSFLEIIFIPISWSIIITTALPKIPQALAERHLFLAITFLGGSHSHESRRMIRAMPACWKQSVNSALTVRPDSRIFRKQAKVVAMALSNHLAIVFNGKSSQSRLDGDHERISSLAPEIRLCRDHCQGILHPAGGARIGSGGGGHEEHRPEPPRYSTPPPHRQESFKRRFAHP